MSDPLLELARTVVREARDSGVPTAIIGALAMAHHGYVRATVDVDLAACASFQLQLRPLAERLRQLGLHVDLRAPDDDDPLAGLLRVRAAPDGDPVDLVNFRANPPLGRVAVERAVASPDGFAYVRVPELVALKLFAGSRFDRDDAARLLGEADGVDIDEVRRVCVDAGLGEQIESLLRRLDAG